MAPTKEIDLAVGPSARMDEWKTALHGGDDALLFQLGMSEPPGVALFQISTFINGMYVLLQEPKGFLRQIGPGLPDQIIGKIGRVAAVRDLVRDKLDWRMQREVDLGLLRWIRRASALTPVLGAGVSMGAGGPSWPALVRALLVEATHHGKPIFGAWKREKTASGWSASREVVDAQRFNADQTARGQAIIRAIDAGTADTAMLQAGAELAAELYRESLFTPITKILYDEVPKPSDTHRAIAELAPYQHVPDRGGHFPGWERIITYNFDSLMSEALAGVEMPHAAWAMRHGQYVGDPDGRAQKNEPWIDIWHLHGYTPRRLFNITDVDFVFSAAQYAQIYERDQTGLIGDAFDHCLASPRHVALYIGCSFTDEVMNELLRRAQATYPGRMHYALLHLPDALRAGPADVTVLQDANRRYLEMGVQPVWFEDFGEIPEMVRSLA